MVQNPETRRMIRKEVKKTLEFIRKVEKENKRRAIRLKRLEFIKSRPKIRKMFPNPRIIKLKGGNKK